MGAWSLLARQSVDLLGVSWRPIPWIVISFNESAPICGRTLEQPLAVPGGYRRQSNKIVLRYEHIYMGDSCSGSISQETELFSFWQVLCERLNARICQALPTELGFCVSTGPIRRIRIEGLRTMPVIGPTAHPG